MHLRPATVDDRDALISLIDAVYREYGDRIHLAGADADLLDVDAHYRAPGGEFIVLDDGPGVRGCHAVLPFADRPGVGTFRRLYLDAALRGQTWGDVLMDWAVDWAKARGLTRVEFWSDTRFARAHRFFERHGFIRDGRIRDMDDGAVPYREYFFGRDI